MEINSEKIELLTVSKYKTELKVNMQRPPEPNLGQQNNNNIRPIKPREKWISIYDTKSYTPDS